MPAPDTGAREDASNSHAGLGAHSTLASAPAGASAGADLYAVECPSNEGGSLGSTPGRGDGAGSASPAGMPASPYSQVAVPVHLHSRHLEGGATPQPRRPMYTDSAAESVASEVSELLSYPEEVASAERGRGEPSGGGGGGGGLSPTGNAAAGDAMAGAPAQLPPVSAGSQPLVDRLDSAHYEPRPPGLLERQDSAHEADEEAGGAEEPGLLPAPSIGDRERQDSANSLEAAVRAASQTPRGRPAFAVALETAQVRHELAGRTPSLSHPDSAAGMRRPSLHTDSAGEEDEPPAAAPQAAPISQAPPQQAAAAAAAHRQHQERRDSAGEMLAAATAAAATHRRPSAAESLSAARQLIMGDMAQPVARSGSSAELCDSPRQVAQHAQQAALAPPQPPAPAAAGRALSLDTGAATSAAASATDRLPLAAAPTAVQAAANTQVQRRSIERAAVDAAAAAAAAAVVAAAATPAARPGMVRRLSLRALRRRSTTAPPQPQTQPQPPVQEEIQPVGRMDSAREAAAASAAALRPASLGTLAAARAAVLPDLAANPPPPLILASGAAALLSGGAETDGGLGRALSAPSSQIWSEAVAAGLRRDSPIDSLTEARRVVLTDLADSPAAGHAPPVLLGGSTYAAGSADAAAGAGGSAGGGGFSTLSAPPGGVYGSGGSDSNDLFSGGALFAGESSGGAGGGAGPSGVSRRRSAHGRGDSAHGDGAGPVLGPAASPIEMQGGSFATPQQQRRQSLSGDSASARPLRTGDSVGSLTAGLSGGAGRGIAAWRASGSPST